MPPFGAARIDRESKTGIDILERKFSRSTVTHNGSLCEKLFDS